MKRQAFISGIILLSFFSMLAVNSTGVAQNQDDDKFFYHITTNRVAIPVYVTAADGKPVTGLTKADFEVREGRSICDIDSVEYIYHLETSWEKYAGIPPESRRQFMLLFDMSFTNSAGLKAARTAAMDFISNQTTPNDLVAVVTLSQRSGIKMLCPFGTRRSQAVHAISTLGLSDQLKETDPAGFAYDEKLNELDAEIQNLYEGDLGKRAVASEANEAALENMQKVFEMAKTADESRYTSLVTQYTRMLEALALSLKPLGGRKNILFFSEGFDSKALTGASLDDLASESEKYQTAASADALAGGNPGGRSGSVALQRLFHSTMESFRKADTVFYVIDTGRLAAGADESARSQSHQDVLFQFSNETRGELYKNLNDLGGVLDDISTRTSACYLVTFKPSRPGKQDEYRKIDIRVNRSDLNVNHQEGYTFDKEYKNYTPQERLVQLGEYISKDIIRHQIAYQFDMKVFEGNEKYARIPVCIEIDGSSLIQTRKKREKDTINLELYGYLLDQENQPLDFFSENLSFSKDAADKRLTSGGLKYCGVLYAEPGEYKVKTIVRDKELGNISSDIRSLTIPVLTEKKLRMVGPIFMDRRAEWIKIFSKPTAQASKGRHANRPLELPYEWKQQQWMPALNPVVSTVGPEVLYVRLNNLQLHPTARIPQVQMKFEVLDESGTASTLGNVGVVDRSEDQNKSVYELLFQADLAALNLAAGNYRIRFELTDTLANEAVNGEVPFRIAK